MLNGNSWGRIEGEGIGGRLRGNRGHNVGAGFYLVLG